MKPRDWAVANNVFIEMGKPICGQYGRKQYYLAILINGKLFCHFEYGPSPMYSTPSHHVYRDVLGYYYNYADWTGDGHGKEERQAVRETREFLALLSEDARFDFLNIVDWEDGE